MPQTLMMPASREIFADATLGNMWTNRTPRRISRTGIDGSIQISTPIHSGMRKPSTPDSGDSDITRVTRSRIAIGTTAPTCGLNVNANIDDIRQSNTPYLGKSNKLDTSIDWKFTNNIIAPPIFTRVPCENNFTSSRRDLYTRCWNEPCSRYRQYPSTTICGFGALYH